jgi:hypothetical protein
MSVAVALANIGLGIIYTCYGIMTLIELKREWATLGPSHFGLAWLAMAFTCGPHHFEHGLHVLSTGNNAGPLDLATVLIGAPAGLTWFLLRVEAVRGGSGDRFVPGTPRWVGALPSLGVGYGVLALASVTWVLRNHADMTPQITPNFLLLGVYGMVGYYLLRAQLASHPFTQGWSLSGLALTVVFPTCGLMHATFAVYATAGRYTIDGYGLLIDWLAVPAAVYFVWVVRGLQQGRLHDWNLAGAGMAGEPVGV